MNATPGAGAAAGAAGGAPGESLGAGAGGMQQDTSSVLLDNLDHDVSFSGAARCRVSASQRRPMFL